MNILFSKEQNELYLELKNSYKEEIKLWNIFNVFIPITIIFIPLFLFTFLPEEKVSFQNLILNGSFSLLGINILFSTSTFLIYSIKLRDEKFEAQITELRRRLVIYLCGLLIFGTIIYVLQIAFVINTTGQYYTAAIGCFLLLILSIEIGKRIYVLKDELVGKSFKDDLNDNIDNLTEALDDLE